MDRKLDELIMQLEAIDHMSVEECFLLSPLFAKAASALRAFAEREKDLVEALEPFAAHAAYYDRGARGEFVAPGAKDFRRARSVLSKHKEPA